MKIAICGDILLKTPEEHKLGSALKTKLQECDIRAINFEVPVNIPNGLGIHKSGPVHSQSKNSPNWIIKNKFNLITLANNHALDFGQEGLKRTIEAFKTIKITGVGTYNSAYDITVIEKNGQKIGFLGVTHKEFGCVDYLTKEEWGTAAITSPKVFQSIVENKDCVDRLYILAHAGVERTKVPLPEWRELYKTFIKLGADGVIACHPHVPQGYEVYLGCPIVYSMGNFLFESGDLTQKPNNEFISLLVIINVDDNNFEIFPLFYDYQNKIVDIDESPATDEYLTYLNTLLCDLKYETTFDEEKKRLRTTYNSMMILGGAYSMGIKERLKNFLRLVLGKKRLKTDSIHLLNLFQCESHRWMMMRLLSDENSTKQNKRIQK